MTGAAAGAGAGAGAAAGCGAAADLVSGAGDLPQPAIRKIELSVDDCYAANKCFVDEIKFRKFIFLRGLHRDTSDSLACINENAMTVGGHRI